MVPHKMTSKLEAVSCPVCGKQVVAKMINQHLDRCADLQDSEAKRSRLDEASTSQSTSAHPFFNLTRSQSKLPPVKESTDVVSIPDSDEDIPEEEPAPNIVQTKKAVEIKSTAVDDPFKPLSEIMRPSTLDDYVGQEEAVGERTLLRRLINSKNMPSIILWGPPGCGKTTLAHIISKKSRDQGSRFVALSAVAAGIKEVKDVVAKALNDQKMFKAKTILFLDEIHRFNKAQQDVFLPHVEKGTITLVGATTENPSFSLNSALLSRCKVIVLEKLSSENIATIVYRTLKKLNVRLVAEDEKEQSNEGLSITQPAVDFLVGVSDGDCRTALNSLQSAVHGFRDIPDYCISKEDIKSSLKKTHFLYDRKGDNHYDTISAFHKSMRFGKANAALYYLARMLHGGEDPRFIARRLMVFASEDIGLADPSMLSLAAATQLACEKIGMPECRIQLSHCTVQFARAPKSRETYDAYGRAEMFVKNFEGPHPPIPLAIRNAPTKLMKELGYAKGEYGSCMPEGLETIDFFKGAPPPHHK